MGILFNSTALGIHFCETSLIFNFKTRLGGEICLCDVNMHKGYCKAQEKAWKQVMQRLRLIVKRTTKLPEDFRRSLSYPEHNRPVETLLRKLKTTVEFRIRRGRCIEAKKTLSYRVSLRRRPVDNCVYCLKFKFRHLLAGICEYFTLGGD